MKFLLQQRFSHFDLLWILIAVNLFHDNQPWIALTAAVVGALVSVGLELLFKASPWKKDAKDVVDPYRQRNLK